MLESAIGTEHDGKKLIFLNYSIASHASPYKSTAKAKMARHSGHGYKERLERESQNCYIYQQMRVC